MTDEYRVIVTGSRAWGDEDAVHKALAAVLAAHEPLLVIHGDAYGVDRMASRWVTASAGAGLPVRELRWPAAWTAPCRPECASGHRHVNGSGYEYCPAAGMYRNDAMVAEGADLMLAFVAPCTRSRCRGRREHGSHGTADCARRAKQAGIRVRWFTSPAAVLG